MILLRLASRLSLIVRIMLVVAAFSGVSEVAWAQTGFDRPGGDYAHISMPSGDPAECALRCERSRRCESWSFAYPVPGASGAVCALKSSTPARVANSCCVSGVRGAGVAEPRSGDVETSIDRFGGDYRSFDVGGETPIDACRAACAADSKCRAWTFVRPGYFGSAPRCYLKSQIKPPQRKPCCVSGVVR